MTFRQWPVDGEERVVQVQHESKVGSQVVALVEEMPGLNMGAIAEHLGKSMGTVRHHLARQGRLGRLWVLRLGRGCHYFPGEAPASISAEDVANSAILDELDRRLMDAAVAARCQSRVLDAFEGEVPRSTIQCRLRRLVRLRLLVKYVSGRVVWYGRRDA